MEPKGSLLSNPYIYKEEGSRKCSSVIIQILVSEPKGRTCLDCSVTTNKGCVSHSTHRRPKEQQ